MLNWSLLHSGWSQINTVMFSGKGVGI